MADHDHGSMDTTEQERTFEGFMGSTARAIAIILVILAFLALTQT